jgi:hypothetical protein
MSAPTSDSAGIRQTIRALKADGWELDFVFDGEEDIPVSNEREAIDAITAVDDAFLNVKRMSERYPERVNDTGWVRFVLGNEPDEVVCDYTTNLECVDTLTRGWYFD